MGCRDPVIDRVHQGVWVKTALTGYHHAKLLRSGGHVLFHNYGALECWGVARDHLVWGYTPLVEGGEVICFAAEENGGGERLTILIYESSVAGHHPAESVHLINTHFWELMSLWASFIKVFDLNLSTGTHDDLLVTRSPLLDTSDPIPGSGAASISGFICAVLPVPMAHQPQANIDLVPEHMIVSMDNQVHIISWETLKPYWSPAIGIGIGDLKSVFIDKISGLTLEAPKDITDFFFTSQFMSTPSRSRISAVGHPSPEVRRRRRALWLKPSDGLPGRRSNDTHGSRQPRPDCIGLRVAVPGRARLCDCTPLGIMKIRRYPARATEQWTCDAPNIYTRTPVRPPNNNLRRSIIPSLYIAVLDEGAKRRKKENERVPRWVAGRWMAIGFPEI
ncbi:hypothetical protein B0H13DRAFT_1850124 [Mycena leptocephala]|nr:hypothetical protein B0H13DRAFT_1850124 [Mycena leptocephala]